MTHSIEAGAVDSSIVYVAAGNNIHAIDTVNSSRPILLFADQETSKEVLTFCDLIRLQMTSYLS
jgi:glycerol kinase